MEEQGMSLVDVLPHLISMNNEVNLNLKSPYNRPQRPRGGADI
jgi:hypothetical protein